MRPGTLGYVARHFLGEPHKRAADRDMRGGNASLVERVGDLRERAAELDAKDDRVAICRFQALERLFVALQRLATDCRFQRRWVYGRQRRVERTRVWPALRLADLIADAIEQGLPQVRLEGRLVMWLEAANPLRDMRDRLLNQVLSLERTPSPVRQAPVGPALQARHVARAQIVQRAFVTLARTFNERERGVRFGHRTPRGKAAIISARRPL